MVLELRVLVQFQGWVAISPPMFGETKPVFREWRLGSTCNKQRQESKTPRETGQQIPQAPQALPLRPGLPLLCKVKAKRLAFPCSRELATWFHSGLTDVSEDPWEGLLSWKKRQVSARRERFALCPFALSPGAQIWSWSSHLGIIGNTEEAEAHLRGPGRGQATRAWGGIPGLRTVPELPASVLPVV